VGGMKPKYQLILDDFRSYILSGTYKAGEKIPSETALQESYNVSRQTVRKAILELTNEGFLRREKGSGTFVSNQYRSRTGAKTTNKRSASSRPISRTIFFPPSSEASKAD